MAQQAYNPFLPSYEYLPDGEPHVFGDRVYLFGSHDRFAGTGFCLNDYVCYSAPADCLSAWTCEGTIYRKEQDPRNQGLAQGEPLHALWAPDVAQGFDGRFYLYYCLDYLPEIGVAVSERPAGPYEFLGLVHHPSGEPLGSKDGDLIQFDPGVFRDGGTVYLFSGTASPNRARRNPCKGSQVMQIENDMLTLRTAPKELLPCAAESDGTGFEGHEFFEASSIRKYRGTYYLVYSSVRSSELCYATSDRPDGGYRFGGTIVDIGDIGINGHSDGCPINPVGNTHGGMELINGQWYIFYHRQTNRTNYSRQSCAEPIEIDEDGRIAQVEVTSCGLNGGPLKTPGTYPAYICCHLTGKDGAVFSSPEEMRMDYPFLTQDIPDVDACAGSGEDAPREPVQYVANLRDGATVGYKYFLFDGVSSLQLTARGDASGCIRVAQELEGDSIGVEKVSLNDASTWSSIDISIGSADGAHPLYMTFEGTGSLDIRMLTLR